MSNICLHGSCTSYKGCTGKNNMRRHCCSNAREYGELFFVKIRDAIFFGQTLVSFNLCPALHWMPPLSLEPCLESYMSGNLITLRAHASQSEEGVE